MTLISFARAARSKTPGGDWSQEELAEIYRVLHLLQNAGVPVCMDRGLTDKDEPWCVFFDPDGENVFLHLARLDGEYLLVSEVLGIRVRGRSFRSATSQFEDAVGVTLKNNERSRKVVAHPASQLMFSLAAIILLVKAKSAVAAERADIVSHDVNDADMSMLRAILSRIQDSIENPVLVAAMVGAVMLSSSSLYELDISGFDSLELAAKDAHRSAIPNDAGALEAELVVAALDEDHHVIFAAARPDGETAPQSATEKLLAAAKAVLAEEAAMTPVISVAAELAARQEKTDIPGTVIVADASFDPSAASPEAIQEDAVRTEGPRAAQNSGSGTQLISSILEGLSTSSNFVVENIDAKAKLDFTGLITIAQASTAEDAEALIQSGGEVALMLNNNASTFSSSSVSSFGSSAHVEEALVADLQTPSREPQSLLLEIIHLFEEVDVYMYSDTQLVVVDADVRGANGGELAFVTGEITDGVTVSLVGSRGMIDSFLQSAVA